MVFVSQRLKEIILNAYPDVLTKNIVSPNASDKNVFFFDVNKKNEAKQRLDINNKIVCGFIGCFAVWHGVDKFMEKLAPRIKQHPNLVLLLIGDGATLPKVKEIVKNNGISDQIILTGNIPHGDISQYVSAYGLLRST